MHTNITAHSGCEGTEVDSLQSIRHALSLGANALEIDVRLAQNGELRLSHNFCTPEEYEKKPLVREAFEMIKDSKIMINCDIKEQKALYPLIAMAESFGLNKERLIITGCTALEQFMRDPSLKDRAMAFINMEEMLKTFYIERFSPLGVEAMTKLMNYGWGPYREHPELIDDSLIAEMIEYIKGLGLAGLNTTYLLADDRLLSALKQADVALSVWTVNDPQIAKRFFDAGVWNVTTREPAALMAVRG